MLDQELLVCILHEAANNDNGRIGRISCIRSLGDEQEDKKAHHIDILEDLDLMQWEGPEIARITALGYQFLNEVDNNSESEWVQAFKSAKTPIQIAAYIANIIQLIIASGVG